MATWARGVDFKNSANTKRLGGVGLFGTDGVAEKLYIGLGESPWSNAGLQLTASAINFKGNKIYHAGDKPTLADIGAAASNHSHSYLPLSGGTISGYLALSGHNGVQASTAKRILWHHNNQNVTLSAAGTGGDLFVGYNEGTDYQTRSVRLESSMSWKGINTLVDSNGNIPWARLTGVPGSFTPSSHNHTSLTGVTTIGGGGATGTYGSLSISGSKGSWAGIHFPHAGDTTLMVDANGLCGIHKGGSGWKWYFDANGTLSAGTVPWSRLSGVPGSFPPASHTHDDRYYTESEINTKLSTKLEIRTQTTNIDTATGTNIFRHKPSSPVGWPSHSGVHNGVGIISINTHEGNYYSQLALSTSDNKMFIRSANNAAFNSWQQVYTTQHKPSAADIGAAASSHNHTSLTGVTSIGGAGSSGNWGSINIGGAKGGWAGVNFTDVGYTFMIDPNGQAGVWQSSGDCKWYFNSSGALSAGTVPWARLSGVPSSFTPASHNHSRLVGINDTRSVNYNPNTERTEFKVTFQGNSTNGVNDGGAWYTLMHIPRYPDGSGGYGNQIAFTDNENMWMRKGTSDTAWGSWRRIWHSGNFDPGSKSDTSHTHAYISTSASCNKNWNWAGKGGQPTWLWGGEDPTNMYVYNPSNFSVSYANSAGSVAWGNVSGKPSTFAPSSHNHSTLDTRQVSDWNGATPNGFYQGSSASNAPGTGWYWGFRMQHSSGYGAQLAVGNGNNHFAFRSQDTNGTGTWHTVWHSANFNPANKSDTNHTHTPSQVGLPNVRNVSLNWEWGNTTPTHIWGSKGDAVQQYVFNGEQIRAFAGAAASSHNHTSLTGVTSIALNNNTTIRSNSNGGIDIAPFDGSAIKTNNKGHISGVSILGASEVTTNAVTFPACSIQNSSQSDTILITGTTSSSMGAIKLGTGGTRIYGQNSQKLYVEGAVFSNNTMQCSNAFITGSNSGANPNIGGTNARIVKGATDDMGALKIQLGSDSSFEVVNYKWDSAWFTVNSAGIKAKSYSNFSDERLKTEVREVTDSISNKVDKIKIYNYNYKDDFDNPIPFDVDARSISTMEERTLLENAPEKRWGIIAQEVEDLFPEIIIDSICLIDGENRISKSVDVYGLTVITLEYAKEIKVENQLMKERIEVLEKCNKDLTDRLLAIEEKLGL